MLRLLHEIQGMQVISQAEGRILGLVQKVYVDPDRKAVSGILVRPAGMGKTEGWIDIGAVALIGEDVLLVDRAAAYKAKPPVGRSLRDLMGMPITTRDGKILGALVDVEVNPSWRVVELILSEGRQIAIDSRGAVFGQDAILLAAGADKKVRSAAARKGFLARLFGKETIDEAAEAIARAERSQVFRPAPIGKSTDRAKPKTKQAKKAKKAKKAKAKRAKKAGRKSAGKKG